VWFYAIYPSAASPSKPCQSSTIRSRATFGAEYPCRQGSYIDKVNHPGQIRLATKIATIIGTCAMMGKPCQKWL